MNVLIDVVDVEALTADLVGTSMTMVILQPDREGPAGGCAEVQLTGPDEEIKSFLDANGYVEGCYTVLEYL